MHGKGSVGSGRVVSCGGVGAEERARIEAALVRHVRPALEAMAADLKDLEYVISFHLELNGIERLANVSEKVQ